MSQTPCGPEPTNGIKIVEKSTAIDRANDESLTFVFYWENGNFYYTTVDIPPEDIHEGNVSSLNPKHHIPLDRIYSANLAGLTLAMPQASVQAFVKTPNFSVYYPGKPYQVANRFLHEAHVLEALSKVEHFFECAARAKRRRAHFRDRTEWRRRILQKPLEILGYLLGEEEPHIKRGIFGLGRN